jgi:hypothetical protein
VLSVPVSELRGDDDTAVADERPEGYDMIRSALTGHPAIGAILGTAQNATPAADIEVMRSQHAQVQRWAVT